MQKGICLSAHNLKKQYGSNIAVNDASLTLVKGECFALLGPNGAGKSTICEMLVGLVKPDGGSIRYGDFTFEKHRSEILKLIGVQLQESNLYKKYTVRETLQLFASFYQTSLSVETLIERLALGDKRNERLEKLSGGQRQRVYIGCALIHNPSIVFLDEPTNGLDPQAKHMVWDLIREIKGEGRSLFLTTHNMAEAAELASRVAIIDHGAIVAEGAPQELVQHYCPNNQVEFSMDDSTSRGIWETFQNEAKILITQTGSTFRFSTDNMTRDLVTFMRYADQHSLKISDLAIRTSTLEDVFFQTTGRSMRDV